MPRPLSSTRLLISDVTAIDLPESRLCPQCGTRGRRFYVVPECARWRSGARDVGRAACRRCVGLAYPSQKSYRLPRAPRGVSMREAGNPLDRARWLDPLEMLLHAPETPAPWELGAVWRGEFSHAEIGALLQLAGIEAARDYGRELWPRIEAQTDETARLRGRLRLRLGELRILIGENTARANAAHKFLQEGATPLKRAQKGTKGVVVEPFGRSHSVDDICKVFPALCWAFAVGPLRAEYIRLRALESSGDYDILAVSVSSGTMLEGLTALHSRSF
jgi:hypothetical protein